MSKFFHNTVVSYNPSNSKKKICFICKSVCSIAVQGEVCAIIGTTWTGHRRIETRFSDSIGPQLELAGSILTLSNCGRFPRNVFFFFANAVRSGAPTIGPDVFLTPAILWVE